MSSVERFMAERSPAIRRGSRLPARTERALDSIEERALLRSAGVRAASLVQAVKLHEIDFLSREAMSGQAMLRQWADTLSGTDPVVAEELSFFVQVARVGKGEVLADTIASFCEEGRR